MSKPAAVLLTIALTSSGTLLVSNLSSRSVSVAHDVAHSYAVDDP